MSVRCYGFYFFLQYMLIKYMQNFTCMKKIATKYFENSYYSTSYGVYIDNQYNVTLFGYEIST
jgi:hypothetical protein